MTLIVQKYRETEGNQNMTSVQHYDVEQSEKTGSAGRAKESWQQTASKFSEATMVPDEITQK